MAEKEYIERDRIGLTDFEIAMCNGDYKEGLKMLLDKIESIPAADVRPVVRGRWIKPTRVPDSMLDECSVCGFDTGAYTFNFCPNCGADMREEH